MTKEVLLRKLSKKRILVELEKEPDYKEKYLKLDWSEFEKDYNVDKKENKEIEIITIEPKEIKKKKVSLKKSSSKKKTIKKKAK